MAKNSSSTPRTKKAPGEKKAAKGSSRNTELSAAMETIRTRLKNPPTDNVCACLFEEDTHFIRFSNNEVNRENLRTALTSLVVNVGYKGRIGNFRTNDLSEAGVSHAFDRAHENATLLPEDPEYMPAVTKEEASHASLYTVKARETSSEECYDLLSRIFKVIDRNRLTSAGSLSSCFRRATTLNNLGVELSHEERALALNVTAMTGSSSFKETFLDTDLSRFDEDGFMRSLVEKTRLSENPKPLPPGRYTVVLSPRAVGELLVFLMWYNFDMKAIDEKRSAIFPRLGTKIADERIRIHADPRHPVCPAFPFSVTDGRPAGNFDMIRDGKFVDGWYSRFWEKKKEIAAKGRWPSNIIFDGTDVPETRLIEKIGDGLFVNSFWYIRLVDLMDGIFTGMTRDGLFRIKDGKLAGSVNNFRFNQNVFEMLMNTAEIGKEFRTDYGVFPFLTVKDFNFVSGTEF